MIKLVDLRCVGLVAFADKSAAAVDDLELDRILHRGIAVVDHFGDRMVDLVYQFVRRMGQLVLDDRRVGQVVHFIEAGDQDGLEAEFLELSEEGGCCCVDVVGAVGGGRAATSRSPLQRTTTDRVRGKRWTGDGAKDRSRLKTDGSFSSRDRRSGKNRAVNKSTYYLQRSCTERNIDLALVDDPP